MPSVSWSRQATLDIQRLYRFLVDVNPEAASRAVSAIRGGVRTLKQFPESGKPIEGLDVSYRDWLIPFGNSGYVARYHFDGDKVMILFVRHQKEMR